MSGRDERSLFRSLISAALLAALCVADVAQAFHAGHGLVLDRSARAARPAFATDDPVDAPVCMCLGTATQAATVLPLGVALDVPDAASCAPTAPDIHLAVSQPRSPAEPRAPPFTR